MRHSLHLERNASRRVWSLLSVWPLVVPGIMGGCAGTGRPDVYVDDYMQLRPFVTLLKTETEEDTGSMPSTGPAGESPVSDEGKAGL